MIDLAKTSVRRTLTSFKKLASAGPRTTIDLVEETSMMQVRILLICALGEDFSEHEVDFWQSGRLEKRSLPEALRESFHGLVNRMGHPHILFMGEWSAKYYMLPYERDLKANCKILRDFISSIVEKRKAFLDNNPEAASDKGDFLTILLTEPHFMDNN